MAKEYNDINFIRLNLDVRNAFLSDKICKDILESCRSKKFTIPKIIKKTPEIFTKCFLDECKKINLTPKSVLFFYRKANYQHKTAHIDLNDTTKKNDSIYAVNWVIEDDFSNMIWYKLPNNWKNSIEKTEIETTFSQWDKKDLIEHGQRCNIGSTPTVVRVDIPHSVVMGAKDRLSVSIRFYEKFSSWQDVYSFFNKKSFIL